MPRYLDSGRVVPGLIQFGTKFLEYGIYYNTIMYILYTKNLQFTCKFIISISAKYTQVSYQFSNLHINKFGLVLGLGTFRLF